MISEVFGIGLEKYPREQSIGRNCIRRIGSAGLRAIGELRGQFKIAVPEIFNRILPSRGPGLRQRCGRLCHRRRGNLLD